MHACACIRMVENDEKHLMIFECFPSFCTTPLSFEMLIMWNGKILASTLEDPEYVFFKAGHFCYPPASEASRGVYPPASEARRGVY